MTYALTVIAVMSLFEARPTTAPKDDPDAFLRAQLHVLSVMHHMRDDPRGTNSLPVLIESYVFQGLPEDAFAPAELKKVALEETARQVLRGGGALPVAIARGLYGIDPNEVYAYLPAPTLDAAAIFREYLATSDRELLDQIMPLQPASVRQLIAVAELAGPDAESRLLTMLSQDWSDVGKAYLYRKLREASSTESQERVLGILGQRQQVDAHALAEFARKNSDERVLRSVFQLADLAAASDPEAMEFLVQQLLAGSPRHREFAIQSLAHHPDKPQEDAVASVIERENDAGRRAALLGHLGSMAAQPKMLALLRRLVATDPSPAVREAALEAIPEGSIRLYPEQPLGPGVTPVTLSPEELRELTRQGSTQLRNAAEAKIGRVMQKAAELKRQGDEHRKKLEAVRSRPS